MAVALSHQGSFGFALQATQGEFVSPNNWLPLSDSGSQAADTVRLRHNYTALDLADQQAFQTQYFSAGSWVEGELRFPLVPGTLTDLFKWVQEREGDNQGRWASAVIDCVNEVKQITDLKVRRMTLELITGQPVRCTLQVVGLTMESGATPAAQMPATAPYLFREAALELATGGQAGAEDKGFERLRVVVDTALEDPEEGLRLTPAEGPVHLYNLAGLRAGGSFRRDFTDGEVYADFLGGTEAALSVTLARGEAVAQIALPRVVYTADHLGLPGSHEKRIAEEVEFLALGSEDGLTPPVALA